MIQYLTIALGVLPAFLMVGYTYLREKYLREPLRFLVQGFLYGIIAAVLGIILEAVVVDLGLVYEDVITSGEALWKAFAGIALPEELIKLLLLWLLVRHNQFFKERLDGLSYATAIGMGFAATENLLYLVTNMDTWDDVSYLRALTAVPATMCFAIAMGFFFAQYYMGKREIIKLVRTVIIPTVLHFFYQAILFATTTMPLWVAMILTIILYVLVFWMYVVCKEHLEKQHLRVKRDPRQVAYYYKK